MYANSGKGTKVEGEGKWVEVELPYTLRKNCKAKMLRSAHCTNDRTHSFSTRGLVLHHNLHRV